MGSDGVMAFADDLLDQAYDLVRKDGSNPKQASLRRAVSTAYYALFHLLIDEAVANWTVARHRSKLARTFDHGFMKRVCEDQVKRFYSAGRPASGVPLKDVAQTFIDLQGQRLTADYDNSYLWTQPAAEDRIQTTREAFTYWRAVRTQDEAQDFLLSLFLPKLTRQ
jgi:uncharacterized protein (UPF0332 family)